MQSFLISVLSTFVAGIPLAIVVYLIVQEPFDKRKLHQRKLRALGILKSEAITNLGRADSYLRALADPTSIQPHSFHFRYTRGAWNSVRQAGILPQLDDLELLYHLYSMNELCLVANKNLRRLQLALLESTGGDVVALSTLATKNTEEYIQAASNVLHKLAHVKSTSWKAPPYPTADEQYANEENPAD